MPIRTPNGCPALCSGARRSTIARTIARTGTSMGSRSKSARLLSPVSLPRTRFGSPKSTKTMIHVTWHLTTIAFLTVGSALLLAGSLLHGDQARAVGLVGAGAATGFAAVTVGLSAAHARSLRSLLRHPGAAMLTATAVLAWWGAL